MSPLDLALARVRQLREAEQKMTPQRWSVEFPMGEENPWIVEEGKASHEWDAVALFSGDGPFTEKQGIANAEGSAALRNAAPTVLGLLEALLATHPSHRSPGCWCGFGMASGFHEARCARARAAIAAFVEGADA